MRLSWCGLGNSAGLTLTVSCDSVSIPLVKHSWTLDQLGSLVARALEEGYEPAQSGRVRAVPDARTIRYYTTLGLVDRPSELRGRTAYYGRRHLLQLVAIKRLQADGLSLREVQIRLAGLDEGRLVALAALPEGLLASEPGPQVLGRGRALNFAADEDSPAGLVATDEGSSVGLVAAGEGSPAGWAGARADFWSVRPPAAEARPEPAPRAGARPLRALELAPGVSLVLPGGPELEPSDSSALARAARPLLAELERLGILPSGGQGAEHGADRSAE